MFQPVPARCIFPTLEAEIGEFWRRGADLRTIAPAAGSGRAVHVLRRSAHGQRHAASRPLSHAGHQGPVSPLPHHARLPLPGKAGWDTHGLPVEVEVCKELGIHSKEEIEAYGVEPFVHKCQQSVCDTREWEKLTERLGFWIPLDEAYVTYHQSYVESVWWALKNLFDRGLLYQGHKIVWWWAKGGTALQPAKWAKAIAKWLIPACT